MKFSYVLLAAAIGLSFTFGNDASAIAFAIIFAGFIIADEIGRFRA